jgi:hypothetical protein
VKATQRRLHKSCYADILPSPSGRSEDAEPTRVEVGNGGEYSMVRTYEGLRSIRNRVPVALFGRAAVEDMGQPRRLPGLIVVTYDRRKGYPTHFAKVRGQMPMRRNSGMGYLTRWSDVGVNRKTMTL